MKEYNKIKDKVILSFLDKFNFLNEKITNLRQELNKNQVDAFEIKMNELSKLRKQKSKYNWFFSILGGFILVFSVVAMPLIMLFNDIENSTSATTALGVVGGGEPTVFALHAMSTKSTDASITKAEIEIQGILNSWEKSIENISITLGKENDDIRNSLTKVIPKKAVNKDV